MCLEEIKPTLTSTIIRQTAQIGLIALFASSVPTHSARWYQPDLHALQQDVRRLGLPGNDDFADVKRLAKSPAEAAGELVSQLSMLQHPERTIVGDGTTYENHVLWVFLALRYITGGMDFCAPTSWKPGRTYEDGIRDYWLHFQNKNCVTFFAVWPSRARTYVAPLDAQQAIIGAWRQWYAKEGKTYTYKPLVNPESWQWTEGVVKLVPVEPSMKK